MFGLKTNSKSVISKIKVAAAALFSINFWAAALYFMRPKKLVAFLKGERREIHELKSGQEDLHRFARDSRRLMKDLFIPYAGNNHRPKSLRPKSLAVYALVAIAVKIVATGFLFFTYPTQAEMSEIIANNMVTLINQSRRSIGDQALVENPLLTFYAQQKGEDMIARDYFAHDTPEGKKPWDWIDQTQYDYVYAGENLAMDFTSAETVHDAFMKSPSHKRNILNPQYHDVGIAVLNGKIDGHQTTLLVEFFGTQRRDLSTLAKNQATAVSVPTPKSVTPAPVGTAAPADTATGISKGASFSAPENQAVIVVANTPSANQYPIDWVIEYSNIFFIAFLIFIGFLLVINVLVKIRIQHPPLIIQSIAVLALLAALLFVKLHFVEGVAPQMLIL